MNTLHGEEYLATNVIMMIIMLVKYVEDLGIENLIINKFGFSKTVQQWIIFSDNRNVFQEQLEVNAIIGQNIRFASLNSEFFVNNKRYCSEIAGVGGVFYTEVFEEGKKLLPKMSIIRWILEIIFPLKYLHDNNMYYMNLHVNNILLDKSCRLLLGPSNYKIPKRAKYYDDDQHRLFVEMSLPKLKKGVERKEILGIYKFWYELCAGIEYNAKNPQFGIIRERYGLEWTKEIQNALIQDAGARTFQDIHGNTDIYIFTCICRYIYIYIYSVDE